MKYKVGDKVKLRESSKFYHQAPDEIGEIVELTGTQDGDPEYTIFCFRIKFPSATNGYRPIDIELAEPASLVGRYIKALVDHPDGGIVKKGEIGRIISEKVVDFPSQNDYWITFPLITSLYELLPVDYYELLPIDDDVPKSTYVARPFPSDGEYIKLIVKHDILRGNSKHVHVNGDMPNVIPKGTITWCTKYYKSNILNNDVICIEDNKYCANIYASCFEIHPNSKHLFEESKFQLPERWAVKCFEDSQDTPELLEWRTNKGVESYWFSIGYIDNSRIWKHYPSDEEIKITYDQFITHVYQPWKESSKSIDSSIKIDDVVQVVHISPTNEEWKGIGRAPIKFNIGDLFRVTRIGASGGIYVNDYFYPPSMFIRTDIKELPIDSTPPVSEPIKPCPKFKVGDSVVALYESHGWGDVRKGFIGVVKSLCENGDYYVDFPNQEDWRCREECLELNTFYYTYTSTITQSEPIGKDSIRDVENVNVLITKKSKIRVLSI
jgi:hypothetical protein